MKIIGLFLSLAMGAPHAQSVGAVPMREVLEIARAISVVQPRLGDAKYVEYAMGIYRASQRFDIEPAVLISITHQESGFREHLPEGPAGETGICQILKGWLNNPNFQSEFGKLTAADMKKPSRSFLFAAWILHDLKLKIAHGTLPYWSFYNSKRFENRFRYFLRVNRNLSAIKKHAPKVYAEASIYGPSDLRRIELRKPKTEPVAAKRTNRIALKELLAGTTREAAVADLNF